MTVDIPPGVEDGMMIRVKHEGSVGENKGPAGDLVVQLSIENEADIQRVDADLLATRSVSLIDTILGGSTEVRTLDGLLEIKIPPGTVHGDKLRIPGRGLPRFHQRGRGDFYVKFNVDMPRDLTDKQKQLLKEFKDEEARKRGGGTTTGTDQQQQGEDSASKKSFFDKIKDAAGI